MAPQARIGEKAPEILPSDFDAWDSETPPETLPDNFNEFDGDAVPVVAPPPPPVHESPDPVYLPALPRESPRRPPVSRAEAKVLEPAIEPAPIPPPRHVQPVEVVQHRTEVEDESESKRKGKGKNIVLYAVIGVILILVALIGLKIYRPATQTAGQNQAPITAESASATPQASEQQTSAPAAPAKQAAGQTAQAANQAPETVAPQEHRTVGSEMMNQQLNAPSRISPNVKKVQKDAPPPPGFAANGMEALGGNAQVGNVFGKHAAPAVQRAPEPAHKVNVSGAEIQAMLVKKEAPVYPTIAKAAHISGTVVLDITISKTGATEQVYAVSGPIMLREAAVNAARNWRYKPYLVNHEATEVEGQASVRFQTN